MDTHTQVIITQGVIVASRLLIWFYLVSRVDFLVSQFENVTFMFHWFQCSFSVFTLMLRVFMRIVILRRTIFSTKTHKHSSFEGSRVDLQNLYKHLHQSLTRWAVITNLTKD